MKRFPLAFASVAVAVLFLMPSASAQYPPEGETLTINKTTVNAGGSFTVSGCGFKASSTVTIKLGSTTLGSSTSDTSGCFTFTGTLPKGTTAGSASIVATGVDPSGAVRSLTTNITVLPLGATGSNTGTMLLVALGLLILGGSALAFSKRDAARV